MKTTVFIVLEGPFQSWGGRWALDAPRPTDGIPTKSGVVGLVACALGWRTDEAIRQLASLQLGVRVDRPGTRYMDYHTVQPIDYAVEPPVMTGFPTQDGKVTQKTVVTRREYLVEARFVAAMQGDDDLVERIGYALQHPRWPVFLGRKSCVPALPVFGGIGVHPDLETALRSYPGEGQRIELDDPAGELVRQDTPQSRQYRAFAPRFVRRIAG